MSRHRGLGTDRRLTPAQAYTGLHEKHVNMHGAEATMIYVSMSRLCSLVFSVPFFRVGPFNWHSIQGITAPACTRTQNFLFRCSRRAAFEESLNFREAM